MTPQETVVTRFRDHLAAHGATVPVESLLLQALAGERRRSSSSAVALGISVTGQLSEPLPHYTFELRSALACSVDDDKSGELFRENYTALWRAFDHFARLDNCEALGDAGETDPSFPHVFAVDGFQLSGGEEPDYLEDENGGVWTASFTATLTGRAN